MHIQPGGSIRGRLRPPSDKSLTHRAVIFSSLANGDSVVRNPLLGEDCRATMEIFRAMGVSVEVGEEVRISSNGHLNSPAKPLDCGNSGTTMRLLCGVLAGREGLETTLVGDESLSRRPMARVAQPLRLMGADIQGDQAPLVIRGRKLNGIRYVSPVASAQIKSALLLAGLQAEGETWVTEPAKSRNHTENMLQFLGVQVLEDGDLTVGVRGGAAWKGAEYDIPADISSAAFWLVAALICPGSNLILEEVGTNPTRSGILDVLVDSGAGIMDMNSRSAMGENVEDLQVSHNQDLRAFTIEGDLVPRLIDEIPILAVLATQCHGRTVIRDAQELKVKESDRIAKMTEGLNAMGAKVEATKDGMIIHGPTRLRGAHIEADGDHRIAMSFVIAGLIAEGETTLSGAETIATSYPSFWDDLRRLRAN